jgi:ribosomal protein L37AE/L43A
MRKIKCQRCGEREAKEYLHNLWVCHRCVMFVKLNAEVGINFERRLK